jgi:4-hydroxybenzoate polyprenyltransferase
MNDALRGWIRLLRLPNHATAVADVLAGFLLASGAGAVEFLPLTGWLVVVASLALYAAGMIQNDVCDLEVDRVERPERPLPSGSISPAAAARAVGLLLAFGVAAACLAAVVGQTPWTAVVGAALTGMIWLYNRHAKQTVCGPVVMGSCRGLNWLLGITAAGGPVALQHCLPPVGMTVYVAGITLFARDEAGKARRGLLVAGAVLMIAGLVTAGAAPWLAAGAGESIWAVGSRRDSWLLLWGVLATTILFRAVVAVRRPQPAVIQAAVGNAIVSIITLDAALTLAFCGEGWAIVILLLLVWCVLGRRLAAVT